MLRQQLIFYGFASLLALALKVLFAGRYNVSGVVWGAVAGFGLIYTPCALRLAFKALKQGPAASQLASPLLTPDQ